MCKKQTAVSHSSSESEIISLDAGLQMDGIIALDLWDVVIGVSKFIEQRSTNQKISTPENKPKEPRQTSGTLSRTPG